jgi:hypothetical protein
MKTILQMLLDNPDSSEFRSPVDWECMLFLYSALGLNDYPVLIKQPMDLGTVTSKLQSDSYRWVEEMLDDLQLIWDNCKTYNHSGSVILLLSSGSTCSQIKWINFTRSLLKTILPALHLSRRALLSTVSNSSYRDYQ